MSLKIGLIGFGRTGKVVADQILRDHKLKLRWVLKRNHNDTEDYASDLLGHVPGQGKIYTFPDCDLFFKDHPVDVVIDFSAANTVYKYPNISQYGIRIVSAISNYNKHQLLALKQVSTQTAILHSPNITLGINFILEASKMLQQIIPNSDIEIIEEHFRHKKDVSGTAVRIAQELGVDEDKHVNSIRVGNVIGKHEVIFGLPNQTIRLVHESTDKAAFAQGAIHAAKWLARKQRGLYSMEEVLNFTSDISTEATG